MRFGSICSGIEAASVAWHPLGWRCCFASEIEKFPRAVLKSRWPDMPLHGDFTTIKDGEYEPIELLVGGTPCQDFSIAGLRAGMAGDRGNLTLQFLTLAGRLRPKWLVWENVPGVLSSNGGRDFGAFLGGLGELGYGWAYRTLDAQYFGVPQRRRRVFVVGHLGDWRRAAAVLFERHCLQGHPAPSRQSGERVAPTIASRPTGGGGLGTDFDCDGGLIANALHASDGYHAVRRDADNLLAASTSGDGYWREGIGALRGRAQDSHENLVAGTLNSSIGRGTGGAHEQDFLIAHALRADGFDASEDGTGRGTPIIPLQCNGTNVGSDLPSLRRGNGHITGGVPAVAFDCKAGGNTGFAVGDQAGSLRGDGFGGGHAAIAFDPRQIHHPANFSNPKAGDPCHPLRAVANAQPAIAFTSKDHGADAGDIAPTLRGGVHRHSHANAGVPPAVALRGREGGATAELSELPSALRASNGGGDKAHVLTGTVRRLTPRECERLQGFPDDYTLIEYRGKPAADGPRYKALGNSMAVPVMRWIGERVELVHGLSL